MTSCSAPKTFYKLQLLTFLCQLTFMQRSLMLISLTGFHDAIGDAVSISITPKHLQGLGLIQKSVDDTAHDINFLFAMAMDKVSKNH